MIGFFFHENWIVWYVRNYLNRSPPSIEFRWFGIYIGLLCNYRLLQTFKYIFTHLSNNFFFVFFKIDLISVETIRLKNSTERKEWISSKTKKWFLNILHLRVFGFVVFELTNLMWRKTNHQSDTKIKSFIMSEENSTLEKNVCRKHCAESIVLSLRLWHA